MNVFEVDIWRGVYHNDVFSHNATRHLLIHALNEERAKKRIALEPEKTYGSKQTLGVEVRATEEFIYALREKGTVTIQPYYVYSAGYPPRPVKESSHE